ncbi:BON domain-containing protein [Hydrogenophaga aquatica]
MKFQLPSFSRPVAVLMGAVCLAGALSACAPLVVGTAMGTGVLVATDRRTSGAQLEDQGIELRAGSRLRDQFGDRARVVVTSFNRRVLLTGEVPSEADRAAAVRIVGGVENVREIVDELAVMTSPSFTARSSDALVTARVKAAMVDASDLQATAVKVLTERGTTYLMGRVTQREADRATEITRSIPGVQGVVRVFEIITDDELRRLQAAPAK